MRILLTHMLDNTVFIQSELAKQLMLDKLIQKEFNGEKFSDELIVELGEFPKSFYESK